MSLSLEVTALSGNAFTATATFLGSNDVPATPDGAVTWRILDHARREVVVFGQPVSGSTYTLTYTHHTVETIYIECSAMVAGHPETERAKVVVKWVA